jgi:hypothetical protein
MGGQIRRWASYVDEWDGVGYLLARNESTIRSVSQSVSQSVYQLNQEIPFAR